MSVAVAPGQRRFKLVANLPYNIATPIITNLLVHPDLCPSLMVVTIQLELAERMRAEPDTADYGSLSVVVQALADVSIIRTLPPSVFWPRPKVDSAVVQIAPSPAKRTAVGEVAWFHHVVRRVFLLRRKNLRRVLYGMWRDQGTDKAEVDAMLEGLGHTGHVRVESLTVAQWIALARALRERLGAGPAADDEPEDRHI